MRTYIHYPYFTSQLSTNTQSCDESPYEGCSFTQDYRPSSSASLFTVCTFNGLSAADCGGAISFVSGDSLTLDQCTFQLCYTTNALVDWNGGGAVLMKCGSFFSAHSCTFIKCSTSSYGGGIVAEDRCESSTVSYCSFISCTAGYGGGLMTFCGPTSSVSSSRFILCTSSRSGGGMYHNSNLDSDFLSLSDSLFISNSAEFHNGSGSQNIRGGGAFEDYRSNTYTSQYSFSFFFGNTAPNGVGNDISINTNILSLNNIIHCFTTTTENSFCNSGSYQTTEGLDWLPLGI